MQAVSLRVDRSAGVVRAVFRCAMCGERANPLAADAICRTISCRRCGHRMDMREATIAAVSAAPESHYEPLLCANASTPMRRAVELPFRWVVKRVVKLFGGSPRVSKPRLSR
jgi:DNA-directed RNA polymerase subunit RPC12/RpoP